MRRSIALPLLFVLFTLAQVVVDTYNRSGVTTAWHLANPVSNGGFYWVDSLFPAW